MTLQALAPLSAGAAVIALGIYALRWRRAEAVAFGSQCAALGAALLLGGAHEAIGATAPLQAAYAALALSTALGLYFATSRQLTSRREALLLHFPAGLFAALAPTPLLLQDFRGGYPGPALPFFGVYVASSLGAAGLALALQKGRGNLFLGAAQGVLGAALAFDLGTGLRLAWASLGGLGFAGLSAWAQARHGAVVRVEKAPKVEPGQAFLLLEERPAAGERLLDLLAKQGVPGLVITRENPEGVRARTGAKVLWLSSAGGEETADPTNLESLLEGVERTLREQPSTTLLFDGFEYLAFQRSFPVALRFVAALREAAARGGGRLLVPAHPRALEEREVTLLSREAGLESWSTLLRPERRGLKGFAAGYLYTVPGGSPEQALALFERLLERRAAPPPGAARGLCISRQSPMEVRRRLQDVAVVWLSDAKVAYESVVGPNHLELLLKVVEDFLAQNPGAPVLLDGLEHLVSSRDFPTVLRFLYLLHDLAVTRKTTVLIPVDPRALDERKMALLARECVVAG